MEEFSNGVVAYPETVGEWVVGHLPGRSAARLGRGGWSVRQWVDAGHGRHVRAGARTAFDARKVTGSSLADRLGKAEARVSSQKEFKGSLSYARLMRNVGTHEVDQVSYESAVGVMSFTLQALRLSLEVPGELKKLNNSEWKWQRTLTMPARIVAQAAPAVIPVALQPLG
jgi:hypothetical protein